MLGLVFNITYTWFSGLAGETERHDSGIGYSWQEARLHCLRVLHL